MALPIPRPLNIVHLYSQLKSHLKFIPLKLILTTCFVGLFGIELWSNVISSILSCVHLRFVMVRSRPDLETVGGLGMANVILLNI